MDGIIELVLPEGIGKYSGKSFADIPSAYLIHCVESGLITDEVFIQTIKKHIADRLGIQPIKNIKFIEVSNVEDKDDFYNFSAVIAEIYKELAKTYHPDRMREYSSATGFNAIIDFKSALEDYIVTVSAMK